MIDTALDAALTALLRGDADLTALMGGKARLFPLSAPAGSAFPHVIYGDCQILPVSGGCGRSYEIYATLRAWARDDDAGPEATLAQAKGIGGRLRELLDAEIAIAGHVVVDHHAETSAASDADGLSALAVVTARYWVEASA